MNLKTKFGKVLSIFAMCGILLSSGGNIVLAETIDAVTDTTTVTEQTSTTVTETPDTTETTVTENSGAEVPVLAVDPGVNETVVSTSTESTSTETISTESLASTETTNTVVTSQPTLTTDKDDYEPGETVSVFGNFFSSLQKVVLRIFGNSEVGNHYSDVTVNVTPNEAGSFSVQNTLDNFYRPLYTVTASTPDGTQLASMTFKDAPNAAGNLDQCSNGSSATPVQCTGSAWQNGNLNQNQAHYTEGDSAPYRIVLTNVPTTGTNTLVIEYDTRNSSKNAIDFLTTYNRTETSAAPCSGVSPCVAGTPVNFLTPGGSATTTSVFTALPVTDRQLSIWNGAISTVTYPAQQPLTGAQSSTQVQITFTATDSTVVLAWGGHIANSLDWGVGNAAGGISGSPYHMRFIELNGKGGNQDRSLSAGAIVPAIPVPPQLTLVKTVTNDNGGTAQASAWTLTATGPTSISGATGSNNVTNAVVQAGQYTLGETGGPSGYTAGTYSCVINGVAPVVSNTITLADEDVATCTINNDDNAPSLTLLKQVVNDNGGTAVASDWTLTASGYDAQSPDAGTYNLSESGPAGYAQTSLTCSNVQGQVSSVTLGLGEQVTCTFINNDIAPQLRVIKVVDNGNTGATFGPSDFQMIVDGGNFTQNAFTNVSVGAHMVTETGPSGYTAVYSGDCNAQGSVSLTLGESKTCTVTNTAVAPTLTLVKTVVNNNGGNLTAASFQGKIDGTNVAWGVVTPITVGSHSASEVAVAGYTASAWGTDCDANGSVTLSLGENKTCSITNDDQQSFIIVNKTVDNTNGGSAQPNDFLLKVDGNAVLDEVAYPVNPGAHVASETTLPGYVAGIWGTDCDANGNVTVALGETKACTITNDDQQAYIRVVKTVINDNGGSAQPNDFALTLEGTPVTSGTLIPVNPGTYTAAESLVSGYSFVGFSDDCDSNGDVTVALGQTKTCTLTNNDIAPQLTVIKHVVNDNGGTTTASAFTMNVTANNPSSASFPGSEAGTTITLNAGTYSVNENGPAGYAASFSADCAGSIAVGQSKTCTITNNDIAPTLTLVKTVQNDNGGDLGVADFTLKIDTTTVTSGVVNVITAGDHTASEVEVAGYAASAWGGDCAANGFVSLIPGQNKICTITNDDIAPKLTINKVVVNDNGGNAVVSDFPLFVNGNSVTSGVENTLSANVLYTASETNLAGYTAGSWTGDCAANGTITLQPGDVKTCTITNDDQPAKIILNKVVVKDNGGTAGVNDFGLTVGGIATSSGALSVVNSNTPVALNEAGLSGYTFVSITGDAKCPAVLGGTVTLDEGETVTCTITNDDDAPTLTLVKTVTNDNGGTATESQFTLTATGPTGFSGVGPSVSNGTSFDAGAYVLSETNLPGYTAGSWSCDAGTQVGSTITVGLGEDVTCTINNNDDAPSLTLNKVLVKDNGGNAVESDWTLTASGPTSITGAGAAGDVDVVSGASFDAGTYTLSESAGPAGYSASAWTCTNGVTVNESNEITLGLGQSTVCSITNNDIAPELTVIKHVINDSGDIAVASDFTMNVAGTNVSTPSFLGSEAGVTVTLNAGAYTADEANNAGYIKTLGADCAGTIAVGEKKVCTITNNDIPHATRTQGFWQTHTAYTSEIFAGFGGNLQIGSSPKKIDTAQKLFGGFYASIAKKTDNKQRAAVDKARMQMLQQWLAAKLNCEAFGCSMTTQNLLTAAATAWAGNNINLILSYAGQLDAYNNSNDALPISGQGKATPKDSQNAADFVFWNSLL